MFHVRKEFCLAGHLCDKKTFVSGAMQGLFYRGDRHCFFPKLAGHSGYFGSNCTK